MASASEIPDLLNESVELSKQYLRQETVEPAKRLGKAAGMGFAAALFFGLAATLGGIAINRWVIILLPSGRAWSGLGYLISALLLLGLAGLVVGVGQRVGKPPEVDLDLRSLAGLAEE
jgi:hypothetical protein